MERAAIEFMAATLRAQVLRYVQSRYPDAENARKYLHPKYAFEMKGFTYEERPDLDLELRVVGTQVSVKRSVIAGQLNRRDKTVYTSDSSTPEVKKFTAAHELAHLVLHDNVIEHRDRPYRGQRSRRSDREREADVFAAAYLMPPRWVANDLSRRFGGFGRYPHAPCLRDRLPIVVDERLAWFLDSEDWERLLTPDADIERSRAMSVCTNVGNGHFCSMSEEYGVTPPAMALRLVELNLIERGWSQ